MRMLCVDDVWCDVVCMCMLCVDDVWWWCDCVTVYRCVWM